MEGYSAAPKAAPQGEARDLRAVGIERRGLGFSTLIQVDVQVGLERLQLKGKEWKGSFYPEDLPNKAMFSYYGERLGAVEINNTFYRLPNASVLESWADQVPDGFRFSIKASRKITHFTRLKAGAQEPTEYLLSTLDSLGDHLGVLLV